MRPPIKMLLIDDEADHASLNRLVSNKKLSAEEKKDNKDASKINRSIRELLQEIPQHAYIGFTASPFANLFVPPDVDEMEYNSAKVPTLYPVISSTSAGTQRLLRVEQTVPRRRG